MSDGMIATASRSLCFDLRAGHQDDIGENEKRESSCVPIKIERREREGGPRRSASDDGVASRIVPVRQKRLDDQYEINGAAARRASVPEGNRDHDVQADQEETCKTASEDDKEVSSGLTRSVQGLKRTLEPVGLGVGQGLVDDEDREEENERLEGVLQHTVEGEGRQPSEGGLGESTQGGNDSRQRLADPPSWRKAVRHVSGRSAKKGWIMGEAHQ